MTQLAYLQRIQFFLQWLLEYNSFFCKHYTKINEFNVSDLELLKKAENSLKLVLDGIDNMVSEDFLTIDLMAAYENLGLIIGEEIEDDLANRIFSKFCMGK